MVTMPRSTLLVVLLFALGCSDASEPVENVSAETAQSGNEEAIEAEVEEAGPVEATEEESPVYSVHEWGMLDILADGRVEVGSGPGDPEHRPGASAMDSPSMRPYGGMRPSMRPIPQIHVSPTTIRKPVLYFHGAEPVEVDVQVVLPGAVQEHWPPAELTAATLEWNVRLSPGDCDPGGYPERDSETCAGSPGGYCERADLETYETPDGACLEVGGTQWDHLFYRGENPELRQPLSVEWREGHWAVVRRNEAIRNVYWIDRTGDDVRASVTALGGEITTMIPPSESQVQAVHEAMGHALRDGLSEEEARAFERAWVDELFGSGESGGAPTLPNAILYFLPESEHSQVSELRFDPPPANISRVFVIRQELPSR